MNEELSPKYAWRSACRIHPVFIFTFSLGTKGAAIATVIGQFMGLFAGILINRRWNREITFSFIQKPDWESVRAILRVGMECVS